MTKNILFFVSAIIGVGVVILEYTGTYNVCDFILTNGHVGDCPFILADIELILLPFVPLFLFSSVTYFMKEEVFQFWYNFVRIYIPFSIILVLLAPSYSNNWMFPYDKGIALLVSCLGFFIFSAGIIIAIRIKEKLNVFGSLFEDMTRSKLFFLEIAAIISSIFFMFLENRYGWRACSIEFFIEYCTFIPYMLMPFLSILPFSLAFLFIGEKFFQRWWSFAKLLIIIATVLMFFIRSGGSSGGGFGLGSFGGVFELFIVAILFVSLIIYSFFGGWSTDLQREEESQPGYQKDSEMTLAEGIAYHWKEWRK